MVSIGHPMEKTNIYDGRKKFTSSEEVGRFPGSRLQQLCIRSHKSLPNIPGRSRRSPVDTAL